MAKNILIEVSADEAARAQYESELIFELDQRGRINHARAEGKAEGKLEGKLESKLEIARNLFKMGLSITQIAEGTGLSEAEIEKSIKS